MFGIVAAGVLAAAGLVAGSWSIMSAVGTTQPPGNNAPLWFSPPAPVNTTQGVPPPSIKDTPKPGSSEGYREGSSEVESGRHHEGSESGPPTAHHSAVTSAQVTVTPTDDRGRKGPPSLEDGGGRGGRDNN
jgi:hypothetical protein